MSRATPRHAVHHSTKAGAATRLLGLSIAVGYLILYRSTARDPSWLVLILIMAILFGRTLVSFLHVPTKRRSLGKLQVTLVMPFYDEGDETLRGTFASIITQVRLPDALYIINDGSRVGGAEVERWLPAFRSRIKMVKYIEFDRNHGKRAALAEAIRMTDSDIIVTTDSDTTMHPHAIHEIVRPFGNPRVAAATGRVTVRNRNKNLLTRLQDVIYVAAFFNSRASLSTIGSVLVCSGAIGAYRRDVISPYLEDFLSNQWMFGEDRHLTSYALRHGRVVLQESAIARTNAPEHIGHYLRQQTRWQRGFLQNSIWILKHFPLGNKVFWMTFGKVAASLALTVLMPLALAQNLFGTVLVHGAIIYALVSWSHLTRYLEVRGEGTLPTRLLFFLVAPLLSLVQMLLLAPVRIYALLTFGAKGWGSRIRRLAPADATS